MTDYQEEEPKGSKLKTKKKGKKRFGIEEKFTDEYFEERKDDCWLWIWNKNNDWKCTRKYHTEKQRDDAFNECIKRRDNGVFWHDHKLYRKVDL